MLNFFVGLLALLGFGPSQPLLDNPWGRVKTPSHGMRGPIGAYSAGCIDGAQSIPDTGPGWQMMRLSRNRYYGHPLLVRFIEDYTNSVNAAKLGVLLVGDMGQPRGGPMPSGHASHQIGLDVDIWYWLNSDAERRVLTPQEREELGAPSVVDLDSYTLIREEWRPEHSEVLKRASQHPDVERIFVSPVIKRELCQTAPSADRGWLRKIRPWWKHHDHFHVRLRCPEGSVLCNAQASIPEGDGCGSELDWWFEKENRNPPPAKPEAVPQLPKLPRECASVLTEPLSQL